MFFVSSRILFALIVAGACASHPASAQESPSRLELPLDTGARPNLPPPVQPGSAAKAVGNGGGRMRSEPLASRGSVGRADFRSAPAKAPTVLATLGLVVANQAPIRIGLTPDTRLLNAVAKGTHLAVVSDGGVCWGVLMVNNTMGWVPKNALQIIDYQTEVSVPIDPATALPTTTSVSANVAGLLSGLPADTDARTLALLREAFTYLGVPYVWAGNTRSGIDCSGFLKAVFAKQGLNLPRHSGDQARVGSLVQFSDLRPGDRLYFDMGRKGAVSHCGIYLGNGIFIHASTNHHRVDVDSLAKPNYYKALVAARRS